MVMKKAGDVAQVINPYTLENEIAFVKKMDMAISNLLVSSADFLSGYTPSGVITGYKNRVVLTGGTSWSVPAGVTEIRAILIGGGQGGQAGFNGGIGMRGYETPDMDEDTSEVDPSPWLLSFNGEAGDGGNGGAAGAGGKIVDTGPLTVTPGASMSVAVGSAGTGGASNGATGALGDNTVFGPYSSANGEISNTGFVDTMTSALYGVAGYPGFKGQKGVGKDNLPATDMTNVIYQIYESTGFSTRSRYTGYLGSPRWAGYYYYRQAGDPRKYGFAAAGGGGGSSYNSSGNQGTGADFSQNNDKLFLDGGDGGTGADGGSSISATVYGGGGYGGHGGGGGGGGGGASNHLSGDNYYMEGSGGAGGIGSAGGNGKTGCIIIYY